MGAGEQRWLIRGQDGETLGPFSLEDMALLVAQGDAKLEQLAKPEMGGKTCRLRDVLGDEELRRASEMIRAAEEAAHSVRSEMLAEAGETRQPCPECGQSFRAVAGVCRHCGAQHSYVEKYILGLMCPFVLAKIGGGGGLGGFSAASYTWQHLPCIGAYCMMWDVPSEQCKIAAAAATLIAHGPGASGP